MTVETVVDALKSAIRTELGFPAFLLPQKAANNTAHIDLRYMDCAPNGNGSECLLFRAEYRTAGTHAHWLTQTVTLRRKLSALEAGAYMPVLPEGEKLRAYWHRRGEAQWVYPSEEESSMSAEYVLAYDIELDIPTRLLED